jgi:hypothetical protein
MKFIQMLNCSSSQLTAELAPRLRIAAPAMVHQSSIINADCQGAAIVAQSGS